LGEPTASTTRSSTAGLIDRGPSGLTGPICWP
jgi:hypothetical protein